MLLGATYAWFTDFTESSGNIIPSGELNAEMYWADEINPTEWKKASETSILLGTLFLDLSISTSMQV